MRTLREGIYARLILVILGAVDFDADLSGVLGPDVI